MLKSATHSHFAFTTIGGEHQDQSRRGQLLLHFLQLYNLCRPPPALRSRANQPPCKTVTTATYPPDLLCPAHLRLLAPSIASARRRDRAARVLFLLGVLHQQPPTSTPPDQRKSEELTAATSMLLSINELHAARSSPAPPRHTIFTGFYSPFVLLKKKSKHSPHCNSLA